MRLAVVAFIAGLALSPLMATAAPEPNISPVEVMILGSYHMANPGRDLHDVKADDVLAPKRQKEIVAITNALARFRPTKVAVEWPNALVAERYGKYVAGALPPSRNEVVQLGFRLARTAGAQGVWGIDADGDFPWDKVIEYARAHGQGALLDAEDARIVQSVKEIDDSLAHGTISQALRHMNEPANVARDHQFYRRILLVGDGTDQPGANLAADWYKRNFLICAGLIQLAKPGDRVVVLFGAGHAYLLRQCVTEMPGYRLIEPNQYLPR